MVERCVLCRSRWPKDKLYSACRCYKKSDSNRLHKECLAAIYAHKETDDAPRCPSCREEYRVSVQYRFMFAWHRVCACRSVGHLFEMAMILGMIIAGLVLFTTLRRSPEFIRHQPNGTADPNDTFATYVVYFLFAVTMCMVPFTFHKVFTRWRDANSDVQLDIV